MDHLGNLTALIIIHYFRYDGSYDGWYLWIWPEGQPGSLFEFVERDSYGVSCHVDCQRLSQRTRIGLVIKKSRDRWDQGREDVRFLDLRSLIPSEVWLVENDPVIYFEPPEIKIRFIAAFIDEPHRITVNLPVPAATDEEGKLETSSFALHGEKDSPVPIRDIHSLSKVKSAFRPREDGYEILEDGTVHFVFDPSLKGAGERLEGSRSIFVLGTHNNWKEGEGDPRWMMSWNPEKKYYELNASGLPADGSVRFKFKENGEDPAGDWFPGAFHPPMELLGLQTRSLAVELGMALDIRHEYHLNGEKAQRLIPRGIFTHLQLSYTGNDLGVTYDPQVTIFKVFAPVATDVSVVLYPDLVARQGLEIAMIPEMHGTWSARVPGDIRGQYYTFRVTCHGKRYEVMDPYCRCSCSLMRGVVTDHENSLPSNLGMFYHPERLSFRLHIPQVRQVRIILYKSFLAEEGEGLEVHLVRKSENIWEGSVQGDWREAFYMIRLIDEYGDYRDMVDPWAEIIAIGPSRGKVIDLAGINQQVRWDEDHRPPFRQVVPADEQNKAEDAIIYEMHLRDFTIAPNSGIQARGLYHGLMERGSRGPHGVKTGLDHLLELGITHVQIMPIQNFTSWIGTEEYHRMPHYNWGYMPVLFNSPEGIYSSNPTDETGIIELKQMIKTLHQAGIRVILDVVYNHYDGQAPFDRLVPYYYFRINELGQVTNGSGTGNEFNSGYPMGRKFILDSVKFWAEEYHVDGFRFDLMGLIDIQTMAQVAEELHALDPSILVYGEPWSAGPSGLEEINFKGKQKGLAYGVFNDHFRNALKGLPDTTDPAFVQGASTGDIAEAIGRGLRGSIEDFTQDPDEVINYVTCHDNLVMRDKLEVSTDLGEDARKRMVKLSALMVLTAQGIPFLHSGMEIYRTKQHARNSYNLADAVNRIDWQWKVDYGDIFRYIQGAIALRKEHPAFRLASASEIQMRVEIQIPKEDQIVYAIDGTDLPGETWGKIFILFNGSAAGSFVFSLPEGSWKEACFTGGVLEEGESYVSSIILEPTSAKVLYQASLHIL